MYQVTNYILLDTTTPWGLLNGPFKTVFLA